MKRECPEGTSHAPRGAGGSSREEIERRRRDNGAASLLVEVTGLEHYSSSSSAPLSPTERATEITSTHLKPQQPQTYMPRPLGSLAAPTEPLHDAKFIDTHCHLEYVFERFKHNGNFASFAAKHRYPANFEGCITTFCDPMAFSPSFGMWQEILTEPNVWGTFGTHPHNAKYYHSTSLEEKMIQCLTHPKCVALGEIGLDYGPHTPSDPDTQKKVLGLQLELALRLEKPVLLHCRDAEDDLFEILSAVVPRDWKLHLHCYTGSIEMARKFLKTFPNLYIGVCGNVTYDSPRFQSTAAGVPLERLLLETDAPYMVPRNLPQHLRGNRFSHPSLAFYTAQHIAKIRHTPIADILKSLRANTRTMYGI